MKWLLGAPGLSWVYALRERALQERLTTNVKASALPLPTRRSHDSIGTGRLESEALRLAREFVCRVSDLRTAMKVVRDSFEILKEYLQGLSVPAVN